MAEPDSTWDDDQGSRSELMAHLVEQMMFIGRSAAAFDEGVWIEAKRLAVSIRVLLYTPKRGRGVALLESLGWLEQLDFMDNCPEIPAEATGFGMGLYSLDMGPLSVKHVPVLEDSGRRTRFADWWTGPIERVHEVGDVSRLDCIRWLANQDGGAHVDTEQEFGLTAYKQWGSQNSHRGVPIGSAVPVLVRSIAFEVFETLLPLLGEPVAVAPDADSH